MRTAGAAALVAFACACHSKVAGDEAPPPLAVKVEVLGRRTLELTANLDGTLEAVPGGDVKLGPPTAGRLLELRVGEGDVVMKGAVLARVDPRPLEAPLREAEAAVREAEAKVQAAEVKVRRETALLDAGVSSRQDVEEAQVALKAAQTQLETARAAATTASVQREGGELRAPFEGVVAKVLAGVGQRVDANAPVVQVVRTGELELRGAIPPMLATQVKAGAPVNVEVEGARADGSVFAIAPAVDPVTGAVTLRVRVKNEEGRLRLGQTARGRILIARHESVLAVPVHAIVPTPTNTRALVIVTDQSKAELREVKPGPGSQGWVEILDGAKEGERFVADAPYAIPDGTPLQVGGGGNAPGDGG